MLNLTTLINGNPTSGYWQFDGIKDFDGNIISDPIDVSWINNSGGLTTTASYNIGDTITSEYDISIITDDNNGVYCFTWVATSVGTCPPQSTSVYFNVKDGLISTATPVLICRDHEDGDVNVTVPVTILNSNGTPLLDPDALLQVFRWSPDGCLPGQALPFNATFGWNPPNAEIYFTIPDGYQQPANFGVCVDFCVSVETDDACEVQDVARACIAPKLGAGPSGSETICYTFDGTTFSMNNIFTSDVNTAGNDILQKYEVTYDGTTTIISGNTYTVTNEGVYTFTYTQTYLDPNNPANKCVDTATYTVTVENCCDIEVIVDIPEICNGDDLEYTITINQNGEPAFTGGDPAAFIFQIWDGAPAIGTLIADLGQVLTNTSTYSVTLSGTEGPDYWGLGPGSHNLILYINTANDWSCRVPFIPITIDIVDCDNCFLPNRSAVICKIAEGSFPSFNVSYPIGFGSTDMDNFTGLNGTGNNTVNLGTGADANLVVGTICSTPAPNGTPTDRVCFVGDDTTLPGTYTFTAQAVGSGGICVTEATYTIVVLPNLDLNNTEINLCYEDAVTLNLVEELENVNTSTLAYNGMTNLPPSTGLGNLTLISGNPGNGSLDLQNGTYNSSLETNVPQTIVVQYEYDPVNDPTYNPGSITQNGTPCTAIGTITINIEYCDECSQLDLELKDISTAPGQISFGELCENGNPITNYLISWRDENGVEVFQSGAGSYYTGPPIISHPQIGYIAAGELTPYILNSDIGDDLDCLNPITVLPILPCNDPFELSYNGPGGVPASCFEVEFDNTIENLYFDLTSQPNGDSISVEYNGVEIFNSYTQLGFDIQTGFTNHTSLVIPIPYVNGVNTAKVTVFNNAQADNNGNIPSTIWDMTISCCGPTESCPIPMPSPIVTGYGYDANCRCIISYSPAWGWNDVNAQNDASELCASVLNINGGTKTPYTTSKSISVGGCVEEKIDELLGCTDSSISIISTADGYTMNITNTALYNDLKTLINNHTSNQEALIKIKLRDSPCNIIDGVFKRDFYILPYWNSNNGSLLFDDINQIITVESLLPNPIPEPDCINCYQNLKNRYDSIITTTSSNYSAFEFADVRIPIQSNVPPSKDFEDRIYTLECGQQSKRYNFIFRDTDCPCESWELYEQDQNGNYTILIDPGPDFTSCGGGSNT